MARPSRLTAAYVTLLLIGCAAPPPRAASPASPASPASAAPAPAPDTTHRHHVAGLPPVALAAGSLVTEADVHFMQGMIAHHAQAVHMSRMAATHGAGARLLRLAQKIDQSQAGEIAQMQDWLRAHGQVVPDTSAWRTMAMPGMLTAAELAELDAARGAAFDRLFLELMIRHHEGALRMVAELFAAPRAAQDVDVSVLANDVESTQTAEIGQMRRMLTEAVSPQPESP